MHMTATCMLHNSCMPNLTMKCQQADLTAAEGQGVASLLLPVSARLAAGDEIFSCYPTYLHEHQQLLSSVIGTTGWT